MSTKISYATDLRTVNIRSCNASTYEDMCKEFNCYEVLPNDRKIKPYFDIEIKSQHCESGAEYNDCWKECLEYATKFLDLEFSGANYCFLNASSPTYACCKTGENKWIISMHIVISNYLVSKTKLKSLTIKMNQAIIKEMNNDAHREAKVSDFMELKKTSDGKYDHKFFDEGVYDSNRKMRSAFANKMHFDKQKMENVVETRPMELVFGTFEQSVISAFNDENSIEVPDDAQFQPISHSPSPTSVTSIDSLEQNKYIDLLYLIGNAGHKRPDWLSICGWCRSHITKEVFINFVDSKWREEASSMWDSMKQSVVPIYWIQTFAKKTIPELYKQWLTKWNIYFIEAIDLDDPFKVAIVISNTLKTTLVLCKEKWFMLTEQNLWKQQKEPSFYIINELRKYIDESNKKCVTQIANANGDAKDKLVEKSKLYLKSYKTISSSGFLGVLTKFLRAHLADDTFEAKLDNNPGKLAFQNGVMDLETKVFRAEIHADDYVTDTIPFPYVYQTNLEKIQFVKDVLLKILNNNPEHLEYFLSLIGFSFIGTPHLEKSIYFCVDNTLKSAGDNGKTFFFDILTSLLPNYVYKTDKSFLEEGNKKVHKQLVMMKGIRVTWADEFNEKKVNAELLKQIGEGSKIENEVMFGASEVIDIMFKAWILTNHIPNIDAKETAVYNRLKQLSYGSHFDRTGKRVVENAEKLEFIADVTLGDLLKREYTSEIFHIIIDYANKYYKRKIPAIPEQFSRDTEATKMKNDTFGTFFEENCSNEENERVALKALVARSGLSEKLVKEGMTRLGYKYERDLSKIGKDENGKHYKGGFIGCFLKPEEFDEEDEM